jgi:CspA family cold shock protein
LLLGLSTPCFLGPAPSFICNLRQRGTPQWRPEKGYGFISQSDGVDVFVHHSSIQMSGYRTLTEGQEVEFDVQEGQKGLQAANVRAR